MADGNLGLSQPRATSVASARRGNDEAFLGFFVHAILCA